jgi:poly(A) polymerase Pap1
MCSTHNVTLSTQQIMTAEFKRGQSSLPVSKAQLFSVLDHALPTDSDRPQ